MGKLFGTALLWGMICVNTGVDSMFCGTWFGEKFAVNGAFSSTQMASPLLLKMSLITTILPFNVTSSQRFMRCVPRCGIVDCQ